MKKPIAHTAESVAQLASTAAVGFVSYSETQPPKGKRRTWKAEGDALSLFTSESASGPLSFDKQIEIGKDAAAPVLSAVFLQAALRSSWEGSDRSYGAFFVAGTKVSALRLLPGGSKKRAPGPSAKPFHLFDGEIIGAGGGLSAEDWENLPWGNGDKFELVWNSENESIDSINFRLPVLGNLEVSLAEHSIHD